MSEALPRFGLPDVDFLETDTATVRDAILAGYETAAGRTLAPGDPVRLFLLSVAAEIVQLRSAVNYAARQNLLSYARGEYLESLGALFGVTRKPAVPAWGTLRFGLSASLAEDYTIPAGTRVQIGGLEFATDYDCIVAAGSLFGDVTATCQTAGEAGNGFAAGQAVQLVRAVAYVDAVAFVGMTAGGAEEESDASLAWRIQLAPNAFSVAGPEKAYIFHAYSASVSVTDVSVVSPTPGVVNVYILQAGGLLPSETLCAEVLEYLSAEDRRPLTDEVHVYAPTPVDFTVGVNFWILSEEAEKAADIRQAVDEAVASYKTWQTEKIGRDINPAKLTQLVMQAGAARVDLVQPESFVSLTAAQVARCTDVTVTYKGVKEI